MAGKFEIYTDKAAKWRWRLKAGNGEAIASGPTAFDTEAQAVKAVAQVQASADAPTVDVAG